jgi:hypothetical protein
MANLIITFGRVSGQLEEGSSARSEAIAIDGTERTSALMAGGGDNVLTLYPEAACWVAVGRSPNAEHSTNRRYLAEGVQRRFSVGLGQLVSVKVAS